MESIIVASVVVLSPVILSQVMRANAGAMFLSACGGIVLLSTLDPVLVTTAGAVFPTEGESIVRLLVIVATIVIAALLFKNSIDGWHKTLLNSSIALLLGLLLLLQLPILTGMGALLSLLRESWWQDIALYDSAIVVVGLGLGLTSVIVKHHSRHKSKHKK